MRGHHLCHHHQESHPGSVDCPKDVLGQERCRGEGGHWRRLWGPYHSVQGQPLHVSPPQKQSTYTSLVLPAQGPQRCLLVNSAWTIKNTDVQIKVNQISAPPPAPHLGTLLFFFPPKHSMTPMCKQDAEPWVGHTAINFLNE